MSSTGPASTGSSSTGPVGTIQAQLIVLAKAPVPGRVKTRLTPPFTPQEAAMLVAAAFDDAYASLAVPVVLIGMDTPQVTPGLLETVAQPLAAGEADAVFGPAEDGGFWLLGLRRPDAGLILGVPMSADHTGRVQLDRLRDAGLRVRQVPELLDVDTAEDAERVAWQAPGSRFAATLASLLPADRSQQALTGRHHLGQTARAVA
jgi:uncharacterized protein